MTRVRDAAPEDEGAWRGLWAGFLAHYDMELPGAVTDLTWSRLMDPACPLTARLAEAGGRIVGFAIHQHHPSTWVAGDVCYLEDLFVAPDARGFGVGRALMEDLITLSRARGWKRIDWNTEIDSLENRRFYDRFAQDDGHIRYKLYL